MIQDERNVFINDPVAASYIRGRATVNDYRIEAQAKRGKEYLEKSPRQRLQPGNLINITPEFSAFALPRLLLAPDLFMKSLMPSAYGPLVNNLWQKYTGKYVRDGHDYSNTYDNGGLPNPDVRDFPVKSEYDEGNNPLNSVINPFIARQDNARNLELEQLQARTRFNQQLDSLTHTDPNTGEYNPFYNITDDTYGTVPLQEIVIRPMWTPESRRRYAAQRGKQYFNQGIEDSPFTPIVQGIVGAAIPADLAISGLSSLVKGSKLYRNLQLARQLNRNISKFDGTVDSSYFNNPDKWYRRTESPEVYGIKEVGKNVTTRDTRENIFVPSDNWRNIYIQTSDYVKPKNTTERLLVKIKTKRGSAHGNRSQAALGKQWESTIASSGKFPEVVLEGNRTRSVWQGVEDDLITDSRLNFIERNWEDVPIGSRIGFKTGEMPMEGLNAFFRLPNGRFRYEPVIPYNTINIQ